MILLGTSHIAAQSVRQIKAAVKKHKPDIIAVELDVRRAESLGQKPTKSPRLIKQIGLAGYVFFLIGAFIQDKLGKVVDIKPGEDMKTALTIAKEQDLMVAFIDRDIRITLQRFSKHFRKREIVVMLWDMVFRREKMNFDLKKVPEQELIAKLLELTKERYPSLFSILIDERDLFMAKRLKHLEELYPDKKVLAVVGAGHVPGMTTYLEKMGIKV